MFPPGRGLTLSTRDCQQQDKTMWLPLPLSLDISTRVYRKARSKLAGACSARDVLATGALNPCADSGVVRLPVRSRRAHGTRLQKTSRLGVLRDRRGERNSPRRRSLAPGEAATCGRSRFCAVGVDFRSGGGEPDHKATKGTQQHKGKPPGRLCVVVYSLSEPAFRRLHDPFREGGVGMNRVSDFLERGLELHAQGRLGDQVARA